MLYLTFSIDYLIIRNKKGKRPFYYVKSYEVERMLTRKGAIDTKERDVSIIKTLGKDRINCMLLKLQLYSYLEMYESLTAFQEYIQC